MSGARLIGERGRTTGLAVRLGPARWKYFSSAATTDALDGHVFRSLVAVTRAVGDHTKHSAPALGRGRHSGSGA